MARLFRRVALVGAALVAILVLAALGTGVLARLSAGPIGPFAGGPFEGAVEAAPVSDWSFARDLREVQIEVNASDPRTLTTWVVVDAGELFIPCGWPASKSWPADVSADPRVRLRADGRLYERTAVRETRPERVVALAAELARKYVGGTPGDEVWFYRLDPRPAS